MAELSMDAAARLADKRLEVQTNVGRPHLRAIRTPFVGRVTLLNATDFVNHSFLIGLPRHCRSGRAAQLCCANALRHYA